MINAGSGNDLETQPYRAIAGSIIPVANSRNRLPVRDAYASAAARSGGTAGSDYFFDALAAASAIEQET